MISIFFLALTAFFLTRATRHRRRRLSRRVIFIFFLALTAFFTALGSTGWSALPFFF